MNVASRADDIDRGDPISIIVVGAGGFGREVLDVIEALAAARAPRYRLLGVVDSAPSAANLRRLRDRGVPHIGTDAEFLREPSTSAFVVGIGAPAIRERLALQYAARGLIPATLIHPSASIGTRTHIEAGVVVCAGAVISTNVRLGRHVTVNPNATIGHDAQLEDFVSVNPGAIISGEVVIGRRTLIGAGAVVLENRTVGPDCIVGASSCVTRHIPAGSTVKGIPAR